MHDSDAFNKEMNRRIDENEAKDQQSRTNVDSKQEEQDKRLDELEQD